jgi:5-methylcytosine-specific restriction endonuclease McrA
MQSFPKPTKRVKKKIRRIRQVAITPKGKIKKYLTETTHLLVKVRDNFTCVKCHKQYKLGDQGITAAHFFQSTKYATKWNLDNIDTMCWGCHNQTEHNKAAWHRDFKIAQLGEDKYEALRVLSETTADWQVFQLKDKLNLYLTMLLNYQRPDIKFEDNKLMTINSKGKWKEVFKYLEYH